MRKRELSALGPEHPATSRGKPHISPTRGAESGAHGDDPDLVELLKAWPNLTPAKRRVILGIVRGR